MPARNREQGARDQAILLRQHTDGSDVQPHATDPKALVQTWGGEGGGEGGGGVNGGSDDNDAGKTEIGGGDAG